MGSDRVGLVDDANGSGEVFGDAVLVGDPRLAVADVVLQQGISPGENGRLLKLRFALANFRRRNEAGLGVPQAGRLVERRGLRGGGEPLQHHDRRQQQPLVPEAGPPGVSGVT